jgi:hypothetical protein
MFSFVYHDASRCLWQICYIIFSFIDSKHELISRLHVQRSASDKQDGARIAKALYLCTVAWEGAHTI